MQEGIESNKEEKSYKYKDLLTEKQYLKSLFASVVTRLGDGIDTIVFAWLVLEVTGSASLTAITFAINGIPNIIFGLVSGVLSSYYSKKLIMFICDIGRGALAILTAILYMTGNIETWHLFLITFLNSSFESFREPAAVSITPYIIKKSKIDIGLSLNSTLVQGSQFVGIILAPICIALVGLSGGIIIDAISFIICGLVILTLKYEDVSIKDEKVTFKNGISDLKEGFLFLRKSKLAFHICIFSAVVNALFIPLSVLSPAYVQNLGMGAEGLTFVQAPMLIAMAIGGVMYPRINRKVKSKILFIGSGILFGTCATTLYFLQSCYFEKIIIVTITFIMGLAIIYLNIPINIAVVTKIDKEYLSRVNGLMKSINLSITPLASFVVGIIVEFISVKTIFLVLGIASIILFFIQNWNTVLNELNQ